MRLFFIISFILVSNLLSFSNSKLDSLVSIGNEQSFQFEFKKANQTFETIISQFPDSPLGYFYKSRNNLWRYLANKDSLSKSNYLKYSNTALVKGELEYDKQTKSALTNFNLGNIYLLESIYNSTEQNTMDAFWATKKAVSLFETAIELDSSNSGAFLGLGTIKYALGFVPGFLGWAISIAGLDGEKSEGLSLIFKAYQKSNGSNIEASYHLGKIYTEFSAEYENAEFHLSRLINEYPNNELFLYQYAILQIDKHNLIEARKTLNKIILNKSPKFLQTFSLSIFLMGEITFKENKYEKAIEEYLRFIKTSNSIDYTGIAYYKIALSYVMLNDTLTAKKYLILARNGNPNIAEDSYANEMSQLLFNNLLSENEKLLLISQNDMEAGKYDLLINRIKTLEKAKFKKENRAKLDMMLIELYQRINDFDSSKKILLSMYKDSPLLKENSKFLFLKAKQAYHDKDYKIASENLESAYEFLNKNDYKLNRLLENLNIKLKEVNRQKRG